MFGKIQESDWKIFGQLHTVALDRFCEKVLREITSLASDVAKSPHERFIEINKLVRERDRTLASGLTDVRRSAALLQLSIFCSQSLLAEEEMARFSPETRAAITLPERI